MIPFASLPVHAGKQHNLDINELLPRITARIKALDDRGLGLVIALLELLDEPAWYRVRNSVLSNVEEDPRAALRK
jgi:hypothetical protein